jgi:hypothetical protein
MGYGNASGPRRATPKNTFVVGVGAHVYVNWSPKPGDAQRAVPMLDRAGTAIENDLADGEEVEILSWAPRSREGACYQIKRVRDGSEWWIAAIYLRRAPQKPAPELVAAPPA